MRKAFLRALCLFLSFAWCVLPSQAGNVTWEGPTGMFLNPTAEVQPEGTFLPQACWLYQDVGGVSADNAVGMASYTFSSRTEIGGLVLSQEFGGRERETAPGLFVRQLIVEQEGWRPAVAAGAVAFEGDPLTRQDVFLAVRQPLTREQVQAAVALHVGVKWRFKGGEDDAAPYGGVEIGVSDRWKVLLEAAAKSEFDRHTPYAVGVQFQGNSGLGLSLAVGNAGGADDLGFFFGIGYVFTGS